MTIWPSDPIIWSGWIKYEYTPVQTNRDETHRPHLLCIRTVEMYSKVYTSLLLVSPDPKSVVGLHPGPLRGHDCDDTHMMLAAWIVRLLSDLAAHRVDAFGNVRLDETVRADRGVRPGRYKFLPVFLVVVDPTLGGERASQMVGCDTTVHMYSALTKRLPRPKAPDR
jgi:hypothetical protein